MSTIPSAVTGYITIPLTTDQDALSADAITYIQSQIPGWVPSDNNLETWLIYALARMVANGRDVASRVPASIFKYFGQNILGLPPINATAATALTTWTMNDALGYTIPASTVVGYAVSGSTIIPFTPMADIVVPPGSTTAVAVPIQAMQPGAAGNAMPIGPVTLITQLAFVTSIASTTVSGGGSDAETDDQYLSRLRIYLTLLAPRPILPNDFAIMAAETPGVFRALAIDGLNPADHTLGNQRMVAVAVMNSAGQVCDAPTKAAVLAALQAAREVNFIVNVIDPTFTAVSIDFTATHSIGYDPTAVHDLAIATLTAYLSPAAWAGGNLNPPQWYTNKTHIRFLEVATVLNNLPGLDEIQALTINGVAGDLALVAGDVPMPSVGAITGTVN